MELYIHIPFCVRKCAYCDFLSAPADQDTIGRYIYRRRNADDPVYRTGVTSAGSGAGAFCAGGRCGDHG